ncbi:fructosamine kinase family protein [Aliikangiella marina]|uniref:Fructosamine kinase family protein n=1 Tax=Aliikangiella marina TaxID=1712262 RepID=A0A545TIG8_9GAMM|nr:fructosamine kinase family protein [Aliikangiella marina]TQV76971.1 fructosamine kinase family protein [Aliikangiella marina]
MNVDNNLFKYLEKLLSDEAKKADSNTKSRTFQLKNIRAITGGDINQAFEVSSDTKRYFVKVNLASMQAMFDCEQYSLETISASKTIKVPQALLVGCYRDWSFLVLEKLSLSRMKKPAAFAIDLAAFHSTTYESFGWHHNNFIGFTPQLNEWDNNWPDFFINYRLNPQVDFLEKTNDVRGLKQNLSIISKHIDYFFQDYNPQVSLVHGDLWSGNYGYLEDGRPVIYDPASYYADHEVDLAMMELFGHPGERFYEVYNQYYPIHPGYSVRKKLYNFYHILNHANLFGGSYVSQAQSISADLARLIS